MSDSYEFATHRLRTTFDNPRVLAEVPSREFQSEWKLATEKYIDRWRDLLSTRVKDPVEGANEESSFKAQE